MNRFQTKLLGKSLKTKSVITAAGVERWKELDAKVSRTKEEEDYWVLAGRELGHVEKP
jgi:hypothetical protein